GYFHAYPYDLLAANERITAAACDAAIAAHLAGSLRRVTFVSSSMVYESAANWPSREGQQLEIPPPGTAYGFGKLSAEYFARAAWDQYRLPYTVVRPFNCVGAGERRPLETGTPQAGAGAATSHVVPDLVHRVLIGENPLRLLGSGEQVRHYTYGGDLAKGIVMAMEHPAAAGQDFNLSSDRATTVTELATLIWHKIKGPDAPPAFVQHEPYPGDVQRRIPDTTKAKRVLGFTATTTLEQMVDEVISWTREAIAAGRM
ncbi:MAG TPA: NAD(P)-dependent oxidoreductase, partial [Streptosporangiaceae bacterium]